MRNQAIQGSRAGLTFIELLVVMSVLTVAVTMFTSMVIHMSRQRVINRENAIAANAARTVVELMRNEPFRDIYPLYNEDSGDDPGGPGTAPGHRFAVNGLPPLPGWPDNLVGTIRFPVVAEERVKETVTWGERDADSMETLGGGGGGMGGGGGGMTGGGGGGGSAQPSPQNFNYFLREDYVDARMGMPRDLNGDSLIDDLDHGEDYIVLPVHIEIQWAGQFGPRMFELYSQIAYMARQEED